MTDIDDLITASEAQTIFKQAGWSKSTFHRRVQANKIVAVLEEGRQRGARYSRSQVLAEAAARAHDRAINEKERPMPSTFRQATVDDMPAIAQVLLTHFNVISVPKRARWIEKNPEVAFVVETERNIVACGFLMPIVEEKILRILHEPIKPPTPPEDIPVYEPGQHYTLYARSVVVIPTASKLQRKFWAAKLLFGLIRHVNNLGARGVIIDRVYAQTDSKHVEHLLKLLGFTQIVSPSPNKNFVLEVATSGSVFAMQYKRRLNEWQGDE